VIKSRNPKLLVIPGPTASGKSDLAVFLACEITKRKWGGYNGAEIISADSRQVYTYLNEGTNKVPGKWLTIGGFASDDLSEAKPPIVFTYKGIPHHCIDFVHPRKTFTVAEYKKCANKAIAEIIARGNIPILAGGTGFYIQAVIDGIALPEVPPDAKLRKEFEKKTAEELFILLKKLDPRRAAAIDAKNPRRLMRAIEIVKATGKPVPHLVHDFRKSDFRIFGNRTSESLMIGIKKDTNTLRHAIEKRTKKLVPTILKETKRLLALRIPKKRIRELGFEYRLALESISGSLTSGDFERELIKETWRYAKRQMTWFKRDKRIHWVETYEDALQLVRAKLKT